MSAADVIAILRALAVIPIALFILTAQDAIALALFVIAALSDALDGWLARRSRASRAEQGPLPLLTARGAFIDPLADKILVVGTLLALTAADRGWPVTVVTILVALREGVVLVLRTRSLARGAALPADRIAKLKTAAEMVGVALVIVGGRPWAVLGTAVVGVAFLVSLTRVPRYLSR